MCFLILFALARMAARNPLAGSHLGVILVAVTPDICLALIGVWWAVYFNLKHVREAFANARVPVNGLLVDGPVASIASMSSEYEPWHSVVIGLAILMLLGGASQLAMVPLRLPFFPVWDRFSGECCADRGAACGRRDSLRGHWSPPQGSGGVLDGARLGGFRNRIHPSGAASLRPGASGFLPGGYAAALPSGIPNDTHPSPALRLPTVFSRSDQHLGIGGLAGLYLCVAALPALVCPNTRALARGATELADALDAAGGVGDAAGCVAAAASSNTLPASG